MKDFILSFDWFPKIGGAHLWLYEIYSRWPRPVTVLTSTPELSSEKISDFLSGYLLNNVVRLPICLNSWGIDASFLKTSLKLFRYLYQYRRCNSIFIHSLKSIPETSALFLSKFLLGSRLKIITYAHGEEFLVAKTSRNLSFLVAFSLKLSDAIISNSNSTKNLMSLFLPKDKPVFVTKLGVNFHKYQMKQYRKIVRSSWKVSDQDVVLITISRMESRKNHSAVIKVLSSLRKQGLPVVYVIGGEGEERENLLNIVHNLHLQDYVKFLGLLSEDEKIKAYNAADIHVMPSIKVGPMIEGFGIVFMEAAAAGLPSIAGNVGGQPEAVIHGKTGFIVDGTNLMELEQSLKKLILDSNLRENMGKNALLWAKQHDWSLIAKQTFNLLSFLWEKT